MFPVQKLNNLLQNRPRYPTQRRPPEPKEDLIAGDLELIPMSGQAGPEPAPAGSTLLKLKLVQAGEAGPGHLDEGIHGVGSAQGVLDGAEEVVGLEDEDHLAVDKGQNIGNLTNELLSICLDFFAFSTAFFGPVQSLLNRAP